MLIYLYFKFNFLIILQKEGVNFSQLNFDPNSNGMTISKSLNLFGELRDMQLDYNNLYCKLNIIFLYAHIN